MALSRERIMQLVQLSLGHIQQIGLLERTVLMNADTVLLGTDSVLDSLNFVAFISDIEDRLHAEINQDLFLVLNDIDTFNSEDPHLSVDTLVQHIVSLTKGLEKP